MLICLPAGAQVSIEDRGLAEKSFFSLFNMGANGSFWDSDLLVRSKYNAFMG